MTIPETIAHWLQKQLGTVSRISSAKDHVTGEALSVQLYRFENEPCDDAVTCCTVGIAQHVFEWPDHSQVRHELIFAGYHPTFNDALYPLLFDTSKAIAERKNGITQGELINNGHALHEGSTMHGFWLYMPVYFEETLYECRETSPHTALVWAIPVGPNEMSYIRSAGAAAFSKMLQEKDPDLLDWTREEIV